MCGRRDLREAETRDETDGDCEPCTAKAKIRCHCMDCTRLTCSNGVESEKIENAKRLSALKTKVSGTEEQQGKKGVTGKGNGFEWRR